MACLALLRKAFISIMAVTVTTAYRMPVEAFVELTRHESLLDRSLLFKPTHELREGERRVMILVRHDALAYAGKP